MALHTHGPEAVGKKKALSKITSPTARKAISGREIGIPRTRKRRSTFGTVIRPTSDGFMTSGR